MVACQKGQQLLQLLRAEPFKASRFDDVVRAYRRDVKEEWSKRTSEASKQAQELLWEAARDCQWSDAVMMFTDVICDMALDEHWNFFVQLLLCLCSGEQLDRFCQVLKEGVVTLATHKQGCRILLRLLEHGSASAEGETLLDRIEDELLNIMYDDFGILIVQEMLKRRPASAASEQVLTACCCQSSDIAERGQRNHALCILATAVDCGCLTDRHATMLYLRHDFDELQFFGIQGELVYHFVRSTSTGANEPLATEADVCTTLEYLAEEQLALQSSFFQESSTWQPYVQDGWSLQFVPMLLVGSYFTQDYEYLGTGAFWQMTPMLCQASPDGSPPMVAPTMPQPQPAGSDRCCELTWTLSQRDFNKIFRGGPVVMYLGERCFEGITYGLAVAAQTRARKNAKKPLIARRFILALKKIGSANPRPIMVQFPKSKPLLHDFATNHICIPADAIEMSEPADIVELKISLF